MASLLEQKPDPATRFASRIDEQLAQAISRIRLHDAALGLLSLAAVVAVYATAMILLDKYLNLPEWVRQVAWVGLLLVLAGIAYALLVRPFTRRINPLYAAAIVEHTIADAKNSVTGYVDSQENGTAPAAVRAAMSARAARALGEADLNRAVDHRSLIIAGGVLVVFLVTLAVLFFIFRPTQFSSLVGRAFVPFSSDPIASRTQITIVRPEPPEPTIATGQTVTVAVHISGKVPAKTAPDRVRLLLRHNPADPLYEELPMTEGETSRDWQVKVPEYLVQNGFWYKVAAGDAETPEFKVTVRTLPLFTDYEVVYHYPKYTRKPADKSSDPNIRAYRGTRVTLTARTNRSAAEGLMRFDTPGLPPVVGRPTPGRPDSLTFGFTVTEPTRYRLFMTTTEGEKNASPPAFVVAIDSDSPPVVHIAQNEEAEARLPANGLLAVDGTIGDDFGIDKVRLRLRLDGRELAPLPYQNGRSFFRTSDASWPHDLTYKDSVDLTRLTDPDGGRVTPREGQTLEYWLEALDNCSETPLVWGWGSPPGDPNSVAFAGFSFQRGQVGRSEVKSVRLSAPLAQDQNNELQQQKQQRHEQERQHHAQQQKRLDTEPREPPPPAPDRQPQEQPREQPRANETPRPKGGNDTRPDQANPKQDGTADKKDGTADEANKADKKDGTGEPQSGDPRPNTANGQQTDQRPTQQPQTPQRTPPQQDADKNPPATGTEPKSEPRPEAGTQPRDNPKAEPTGKPGTGNSSPAKTEPSGKPEPKTEPKTDPRSGGGTDTDPRADPRQSPSDGQQPSSGGPDPDGAKPTAPMPKTPEEKKLEDEARRVEEELNRDKASGGNAKPNPSARPEERTDPGQSKPQAKDDPTSPTPGGTEAESKPGPETAAPNRPRADATPPAESKPQGKPEPPPARHEPKPQPGGKADPAEKRDGPLGGTPAEDKATPRPPKDQKDMGDPREPTPNQPRRPDTDPASGSSAKPATQKPAEPGTNPEQKQAEAAARAGQSKPTDDLSPGRDKTPVKPTDPQQNNRSDADPAAGDAKPQQPPESGAQKPAGPDAKPEPDIKPPPSKQDPTDPKARVPAESKPDVPRDLSRKDDPLKKDGTGEQTANATEKGTDKPSDPRQQTNPARDTKPDPRQRKEIEDAVRNLDDPDPAKQQEARDKLDKMIGEQNRRAIEQVRKERRQELERLQKDLQSEDPNVRSAAQKKLDEFKKQLEEMAQKDRPDDTNGPDNADGKPLLQEIEELAKKARDLNSPDEGRRQAAERELDDKLGRETRERIQQGLKKRPDQPARDPKDPTQPRQPDQPRQPGEDAKLPGEDKLSDAQLQKEIADELFRRRIGPGRTPPPLPPSEDDPRHRARTAELQLEEFQRHRYDKNLHERLGWTQEKYDEFLKAQEERVKQLRQQAARAEDEPKPKTPDAAAPPAFKTDFGSKVETRPGNTGPTTGSGAATAPPGFDEAKRLFQEALQKRDPRK